MQESNRDTDIKNSLLDSVGEGKGGMIWKNSTETYIIVCEIDHQFKFDAWNRALKANALGQPRQMGMGGGRSFGMGGHMYTCGWFMSMYGKNHHNI